MAGAGEAALSAYTLVVNDDGLHSAQQVCTTMSLQTQQYGIMVSCERYCLCLMHLTIFPISVTDTCILEKQVLGFQGGVDVSMILEYNGPDTNNVSSPIQSVSAYIPLFALTGECYTHAISPPSPILLEKCWSKQ